MYRKFGEISACGFYCVCQERQTDRHTDTLIAILRSPTDGRHKIMFVFVTNYQRCLNWKLHYFEPIA